MSAARIFVKYSKLLDIVQRLLRNLASAVAEPPSMTVEYCRVWPQSGPADSADYR